MARSPDGLRYRFVGATHDFGRSPVPKQGIVFHMAEGNRVVEYLSGAGVLRNVSATFAITTEGEVVQMLPLDHTSGSLNPRDVRRSTDKDGFWGRRWTRFYDPDILTGKANQRTISIECAGFASAGPNRDQVRATVQLVATLRDHFKRPLGFGGHRDFADYKLCPGRSAGVKDILIAVGHGPEGQEPKPEKPDPCQECADELALVKAQLVDAEDVIATELTRLGRAVRHLERYAARSNEGEVDA